MDTELMTVVLGLMQVKRRVILHEGNQRFSVHSLTARGQKLTLPVMVLYRRIHHRNNEPLHHTEMSSTNDTKVGLEILSVVQFPQVKMKQFMFIVQSSKLEHKVMILHPSFYLSYCKSEHISCRHAAFSPKKII